MAPHTPRHRLDPGVRPKRTQIHVELDPQRSRAYRGEVAIEIELDRSRRSIRLHAVDLELSRPRVEVAGAVRRARVARLREPGAIAIECDAPIPAGPARLRVGFAGTLRKDLSGLYGVSVGKRRYAFTQLEAADARKFFPCFDEPSLKSRFALSVTTRSDNAVLSNSRVRRVERHAGGRKTVHFAETPPLSTYLVALAVGDLEASKPVALGPTQIRVWHTPGKRRQTAFALEAARECLERLESYFGLPYPYSKLDLVAVPDFEFGAMENAGAVFFRETLLLIDPQTATLNEKKRAAEVICHELAHMWYGDLVTMAWWDDLWLNEAFATWMAFSIVDAWKPEWKMWLDFQHGTASALELDALRHTHPIYCRVHTPEQADENFDRITYEKGAAVVRMLERYLGAATFRRGVRAYIRRHQERNAVAADLWNALSDASGEDVEPLVRPWIEQEGYPLLEIRRAKRAGRSALELRQRRFLQQPARAGAKPVRWPIPWVGRIGGGPRGGRARLERRLLRGARERLPLRDEPRFVYGNAHEGGFFRPLHGADEISRLAASLGSLTAVERMGLIDHQWALVRAGEAKIGSLLELTGGFARESDADVLATLRRPLSFIAGSLIPDAAPACGEPLRAWLLERYEPPFEQLGFEPAPREPDDVRLRRAVLLAIVGGVAESPRALEKARQLCDRYLDDRRAIDANLADAVVALAARAGDARLQRRYCDAALHAPSAQERRRFLLALGDFRAPQRIDETLRFALSDSVATQDVAFVLVRLLANPAARERSWAFIARHWTRVRSRVPPHLCSQLIEATPALLTGAYRRSVARFFRAHPVPTGERALRQALERFDWYLGFRARAARDLERWLARVT
ncbi:MAG TPA: M1 family metallopeptidase [Myxococcota bacterium]|nr:M1 family metallopeptidase [Myxococcota bacterium]